MTKTISKVGNSQGIIFDAALMDLARLKVGDEVNITVVPESGAIMLMPLRGDRRKKTLGLRSGRLRRITGKRSANSRERDAG